MNLEDVLNSLYGLQQDEWSLTNPNFGIDGQLTVVGWGDRDKFNVKLYILKCGKCSEDPELFGEGYFRCLKSNLLKGAIPCGCSKSPLWSKEQYSVLCSRKAKELGYTFLGFDNIWKGKTTKIKMLCEKHGEWGSGTIHPLINNDQGCMGCGSDAVSEAKTKPDSVMIQSFFDSGNFHPETEFWRSDRLSKRGYKAYWYISCPECGEIGESTSSDLRKGCRPCACSAHRQQQAYINWLMDGDHTPVAIKFGIANNSKRRIKNQDRQSTYTLKQHSVYIFSSVYSCKKAEGDCKKELECGVVLKRDMLDGYTETTYVYNLEKIIEIYERNGGVLCETL